ncbi:hypothetical protein F4778DRAFT_676217 [Xylariomycetidae sp. FL2044]|nr:hypothetical protein F4778DRAFT_676217 [Xylariomycetidae sp. FL2044]
MPTQAGNEGGVKVSLATVDDIPYLIDMFQEAFKGPGEAIFPHNDGGRKWLQRSFENFLGKKSYYRAETKIAVVRSPNGRPVSMVIAHIVNPGQNVVGKSWKTRWSRCEDIPGISEQRVANFFEPNAKAHHLVMGKDGHIFIELVITRPGSRRKGYGSELVKWASKLADEHDVASYLDGGGRGMGICRRNGFVAQDIEHRYGDTPPCVPMLRPKRD